MRGWTKHLLDGSTIVGEDRKVYRGKASWSRTPVDLAAASIEHDRFFIKIVGPSEYHQSDDFIVRFGESHSQLTGRRLQVLVKPYYKYAVLQAASNGVYVTLGTTMACPLGPIKGVIRQEVVPLEKQRGMWLTTELNIKTGQIKVYFDKNKI
jgi:hypothetical protein